MSNENNQSITSNENISSSSSNYDFSNSHLFYDKFYTNNIPAKFLDCISSDSILIDSNNRSYIPKSEYIEWIIQHRNCTLNDLLSILNNQEIKNLINGDNLEYKEINWRLALEIYFHFKNTNLTFLEKNKMINFLNPLLEYYVEDEINELSRADEESLLTFHSLSENQIYRSNRR